MQVHNGFPEPRRGLHKERAAAKEKFLVNYANRNNPKQING